MECINAQFEVVRVDSNTWDVIIVAEDAILKSFVKVYPKLFYIEQSVFDCKPAVVAPDFPNQLHAASWKSYWERAFSDPDNACKTCATVNQLFTFIEDARQKSS